MGVYDSIRNIERILAQLEKIWWVSKNPISPTKQLKEGRDYLKGLMDAAQIGKAMSRPERAAIVWSGRRIEYLPCPHCGGYGVKWCTDYTRLACDADGCGGYEWFMDLPQWNTRNGKQVI